MKTSKNYNETELKIILDQLKSPKQMLIDYSTKDIMNFLNKNNKSAEDIINRISNFLDKNINEISIELFIKIIENILKVLEDSNLSITDFINKIFPLLMHIFSYSNKTKEQFDSLAELVGLLIQKSIDFSSEITESYIRSIIDKLRKDQNFKNEYTKYALLLILKQFIKYSPIISYNIITESFDLFNEYIIVNYKDNKDYIRIITQQVIKEFLLLLSNREIEIRLEYTEKIYNSCVNNYINNNNCDVNVILGIISIYQILTIRPEFFNKTFSVAMDFLDKNKNHKNNIVKIAVINIIPYMAEYLKDIFEAVYFDSFISNMINLYKNKPANDLRNALLINFGKLSAFISADKFKIYHEKIVKLIKSDIEKVNEKNTNNINIYYLDCLTNFYINYSNETLLQLPFELFITKVFYCGFTNSHINFFKKLLSLIDEEQQKKSIVISHLILNAISIIICDRTFYLNYSYENMTKELNLSQDDLNTLKVNSYNDNKITEKRRGSVSGKEKAIKVFTDIFKDNKPSENKFIDDYLSLLQESNKAIYFYLNNNSNNNNSNTSANSNNNPVNSVSNELIQHAISCLGEINSPVFAKDIFYFYQRECLKLLIHQNNKIKENVIKLSKSSWIPIIDQSEINNNIHNNRNDNNNNIIIDKDIEYGLYIILDCYLNVILNDIDDNIKLLMINYIDDSRYHYLLSIDKFFNKFVSIIYIGTDSIRRKIIMILGKIIKFNYSKIRIFIKKSILSIVSIMDISNNLNEIEKNLILLSFYIEFTGKYILDYINFIQKAIKKFIRKNEAIRTDYNKSILHGNNSLLVSILKILSDVINNHYYDTNKTKKSLEYYFKIIFEFCIVILKEDISSIKHEMAFKTILAILENSTNKNTWNIYTDYTELVILIICVLIRRNNKNLRKYALKIFGFMGVMEHDKLEKLISNYDLLYGNNDNIIKYRRHKNKKTDNINSNNNNSNNNSITNNNINSSINNDANNDISNMSLNSNNNNPSLFGRRKSVIYTVDNFGNLNNNTNANANKSPKLNKSSHDYLNDIDIDNDTNILNRKIMIIKNIGNVRANIFNKITNLNIDFQKEIEENDLDPCTYQSVKEIMKILRFYSNPSTNTKVISVLKKVLDNINESDYVVTYLVLPTLIECLKDFDNNLLKSVFDIIKSLIKNSRNICKTFIKDIIYDIILKYINVKELQNKVLEILMQIFELYGNDMEKYFTILIPPLLEILRNINNTSFTSVSLKTKNLIYNCFVCISNKLSDYLDMLIPEIINTIYSSIINIKNLNNNTILSNMNNIDKRNYYLSFNDNEKSMIDNFPNTNGNLNINRELSFQGIADDGLNNDDLFNDDEVFLLITQIIKLKTFKKHIGNIINILLKYMETLPESKDKILKVFIAMTDTLRSDFLVYFSKIISVMKSCGVPLLDYFILFKNTLDFDKNSLFFSESSKYKRKISRKSFKYINTSDKESSYNHHINNNSDNVNIINENAITSRNNSICNTPAPTSKRKNSFNTNKMRNRTFVLNKDELLNAFINKNCSIEDDWNEWFKASSKYIFLHSPSNAVFFSQNLIECYPNLLKELFNYAYCSVWKILTFDQKQKIVKYQNNVLQSKTCPKEIKITLLNLCEFMEREENITEFLDFDVIGKAAYNCKSYAKSLNYFEKEYSNSQDFKYFGKLISLYNELELPECAIGIMRMAKLNEIIINEEDLFIKLRQWTKALHIIKRREKINEKENNEKFDVATFKNHFICLDGLCDWENLLKYGEEINNKYLFTGVVRKTNSCNCINMLIKHSKSSKINSSLSSRHMKSMNSFNEMVDDDDDENFLSINRKKHLAKKMAPYLANASYNLEKWDELRYYNNQIQPENDDEKYDKHFFSAVLAIRDNDFENAQIHIDDARDLLDTNIKALFSESYQSAYKLFVQNEHLYKLEEVIQLKKLEIACLKKEEELEEEDEIENEELKNMQKEYQKNKEILKIRWDKNFYMSDRNIKAGERVMTIRKLVFTLAEDFETHLQLAKICRNQDCFTTCMIVLNRLYNKLENQLDKFSLIKIKLCMAKSLYLDHKEIDTEKAIEIVKKIIDKEIDCVKDNLIKAKIYRYYADWNLHKMFKTGYEIILHTDNKIKPFMDYLQLSLKLNNKNYKAWHYLGYLNYKFLEGIDNKNPNYINFAYNAINGFTQTVCLGNKNLAKVLQDLLRIIELWFKVGYDDKIDRLINTSSFEKISIESWIFVIPQLLARLGINNDKIRKSLTKILVKIGNNHPRSLDCALIVILHSKSKRKSNIADSILKEMRHKSSKLIDECSMVISELNRCALLLHEEWSEVIDESAKLFFKKKDLKNTAKILKEAHQKMSKKASTLNEIHFHQLFKSELDEAENYLNNFLHSYNELYLRQAWDIYHPLFKTINEKFSNIKVLDLENISPNLAKFKDGQSSIPGSYKCGQPIVKIVSFNKQLTVLNSKQHPRKILLYGSDNKEYLFLLKAHEDLRQDERAMQLFGLVNALLSKDNSTKNKKLLIKRFPVIPLSNNTGLIGWISNTDTLNQLIKEYRTANKIAPNVEHRIMYTTYPKFDSAIFLTKLEIFKCALNCTLGVDLYKVIWKKSLTAEIFLERRTTYSRTLAVMSIVGYILGLGDRHPSNLMLDRESGKIIHIDFGDCFEVAMKRQRFPERVPFRLTRMLIKALEISGIEGSFRSTCENVMRVLRYNKGSLVAILSSFIHDPLVSFRILIPLVLKNQRKAQNNFSCNNVMNQCDYEDNGNDNIKKIIMASMNMPRNLISSKEKDDQFASFSIKSDNSKSLNNSKNNSNKQNEEAKSSSPSEITSKEDDKLNMDKKFEKRRVSTIERKLYIEFEENDGIESSEDLNQIAKIVLQRIKDKLDGTDFLPNEHLDVEKQIDKLIAQATSHENLAQSYLGWCPFW